MTTRARFGVARGLVLLGGLLLVARLIQVQVLEHTNYRELADAQWVKAHTLAPRRGDIFDRHGRPLALSVTATTLGVATSRVEDPLPLARVLGPVVGMDPAALARRITKAHGAFLPLRRDAFLEPAQQEALRRFPAITIDEGSARVYPLDGVGASLIGFYHQDSRGDERTAGLECGLDALLAGQPGRAIRLRSADPRRNLGDVVVTPAVHGHDVELTIDADLQEICESQLTRAVSEYGAAGGSVLIIDPSCGDVLAAASWPTLADRTARVTDAAMWNNRNFSFQYEPGSVFKIFTAASLLGAGAIDTATTIDCADGHFDRFVIREADGHEFGRTSFMDAFAKSSNVFFARAVANLTPREFYRDLQTFGFGQRTNAPYPVEPAGLLHAPAQWSGRSQATMAIGQEVAVTPLQLGLAVAAVANGGTLFAPRLVREIRDQDGSLVRHCPPTPLRMVMPPALARTLRTAMARVVSSGTGVAAQRDWIALGGKTGTAQKSVDGRGYAPNKYVATFAGIVPWDAPRLVILTVLDEPRGWHHYAAQSAVPLFGQVVQEIRRSTDWLTDLDRGSVRLAMDPPGARLTVPDVLYLSSPVATARLVAAGLLVDGADKNGIVLQQVPAPGTRIATGSTVVLTVRGTTVAPQTAAVCPDLGGLSNRQVQALAARLGIAVRIDGVGYVVSQAPAAGEPLPSDGLVVTMESTWAAR